MPEPLIESFSLYLPNLPPALEGLRLLQVTDLHTRRPRRQHEQLCRAASQVEVDLLLVTGDLMHKPGCEGVVRDLLVDLIDAAAPNVGTFGVWGNHDPASLRDRLADLPVHWLANTGWTSDRLPLSVLGVDCSFTERRTPRGDLLGALLDQPAPRRDDHLKILLAHMPHWLPVAAALNIPLVFSGHTHGGQLRAPSGVTFYNATPGWPLHLSTGILQAGHTFAIVSRGLGESWFDGLRLFCRPHAPLITLQRTSTEIPPAHPIACIKRW